MTDSNVFSEISVLIPGYSIEDLPTELDEAPASSLLNAIACAWHPRLLSRASGIPILRQAESMTGYPGRRCILVPSCSESWMPHEWRSTLRNQGHVVIDACTDRSDYLAAIEFLDLNDRPTSDDPQSEPSPPARVPDFLALGIVLMQTTLLSRRRHHYVDADSMLLTREATAAARASLVGDDATTALHLQRCFDHLRDVREKFFPTDCYLVDLCIPSENSLSDDLRPLLKSPQPLSVFATGRDLTRLTQHDPTFRDELANALQSGPLHLLTGHESETRVSLGTMAFVLHDLRRCWQTATSFADPGNIAYARRRFGLAASLPMLLQHVGFESALHVVLDDGLYPDRDRSQFDWRGPDGSVIAATSRMPIGIDSAAAFLKFADRFNESMSDETTAALFLARLPQLRTPWFSDLQIASSYAPVLGHWTTLGELRHLTEGRRHPESHPHSEYLSPFLIQSTVLKSELPISSPALVHHLQLRLTALNSLKAIAFLAKATLPKNDELADQVSDLEFALADTATTRSSKSADCERRAAEIERRLDQELQSHLESLLARVPQSASTSRGVYVANTLPFARTVQVNWPFTDAAPTAIAAIEAFDDSKDYRRLLVKIPPGGFAWLVTADSTRPAAVPTARSHNEPPLAEPFCLRNRHFEVSLSKRSGGIEAVRFHGTRANRLSQQVCFRYEREQSVTSTDPDEPPRKASYSNCRVVNQHVVSSGNVFAAVMTTSELRSPVDDSLLATVSQTTSIDRLRPRVHVRIQFDTVAKPPKGNPLLTYFGARFAWDNELATITRSVLGQAAGIRSDRFESPDYIEVSDGDQRLCIVPHGRPYHRKSGPRMLDSLLIVEGEASREFEFTIDFDQPFPMQSALDANTLPLFLLTADRAPTTAAEGWILGCSARNVMLVDSHLVEKASEQVLRVVLVETEGSSVVCQLRTARKVASATLKSDNGSPSSLLEVSEVGVRVPFGPFQLREVELQFS